METLEKIPTNKPYIHNGGTYRWFNYQDKVYIIKRFEEGVDVNFQFDGTSCLQASVRGKVYKKFETKNKWFNPNWWYKKTSWSQDSSKLYFHTKDINVEGDFLCKNEKEFKRFWNSIYEKATELGRPVENILKSIKRDIKSKTGLEIDFDFQDITYGKHWYEAYIPILIKGEKYLLTWENCD